MNSEIIISKNQKKVRMIHEKEEEEEENDGFIDKENEI